VVSWGSKGMGKIIVLSSNTSFSLYNFRLPLMRELKKLGYRVVAVSPKESDYAEFLAKEFEFYPIRHLDRKGTNPIKDFLLFLEYLRLYKKLKPELVINFTIKPNIYSSIACGLLGIPSISVVTGLGYAFIKEFWLTKLVKSLYKIAFSFNKYIIFLNREDKEFLKHLAGEKAYLIESEGIDTNFFSPEQCQSIEKNEFTFLFVGRLLKDKGVYELVKAFEHLKQDYPRVKLVIVGDVDKGNPASLKEEELLSWKEQGLLKWFGFQKDVRPFYCMADCVVLPSYYREGIPRVLLEAMAMGKPIITTNSPGCKNVCLDGINGFLVQPKDIENLYLVMKRTIELAPEILKKMGQKGREIVEEKYEISKIISQYTRIIEEVLNFKTDHEK